MTQYNHLIRRQSLPTNSEEASSTNGNRCRVDNDACQWVTLNRWLCEYGRDPVDL
jgi:hypothetical protein